MLEVFVDLLSQPCRALIIFLTVNKIPHTVHTVALRRGENRTPKFTKLNPMQKVPVMRKDGFILTESVCGGPQSHPARHGADTAETRVPDIQRPSRAQESQENHRRDSTPHPERGSGEPRGGSSSSPSADAPGGRGDRTAGSAGGRPLRGSPVPGSRDPRAPPIHQPVPRQARRARSRPATAASEPALTRAPRPGARNQQPTSGRGHPTAVCGGRAGGAWDVERGGV
ncbi:glutathione S-transferase theta-2 isoform 1-T1 [Clarias gariepinus]